MVPNDAKWCFLIASFRNWLWRGFQKPTWISLVLMNSFLKSPRPSLPLKRAPPLSPSPFPLRGQGMCQPPYSVLKPLRYKVGGPSEVSPAAELHFAVCDRMDTNCLGAAKALKVKKTHRSSSPWWPKSSWKQHALKGQKLLAQGIALGIMAMGKAPCKGKSFKIHLTQLSQIGKFKKLKPYALQLKIQTIRLLS